MTHTTWLIWDKFCVSAPSNTENVSDEKLTTGIQHGTSDLDSYPMGNLPTYDEALKIENMTNNQLRRRISSQQSIKSDDFKAAQDHNSYDFPVSSPWFFSSNKWVINYELGYLIFILYDSYHILHMQVTGCNVHFPQAFDDQFEGWLKG